MTSKEIAEHLPIPGADVLICGPNWLGDCILSMPAVQALKEELAGARVTVLTREGLLPLWRMNPEVDAVIPIRKTFLGTLRAIAHVKVGCFDEAFVLPHSFRAAFIPFVDRIPVRWGLSGYGRGLLLTHPVARISDSSRKHQIFEYMEILGLRHLKKAPLPRLVLPRDALNHCWQHLFESGFSYADPTRGRKRELPIVGILPGAARGLSKRWPAEFFAETGRNLAKSKGCRLLVFGTSGELSLCHAITDAIGSEALNMAGKTSLCELAAMLTFCDAVVANDNGGMHLASALGTPVTAIFGTTDPARTGPIAGRHRILQVEGIEKSRSVDRNSSKARRALRRITPDQALEAVCSLLNTSPAKQNT